MAKARPLLRIAPAPVRVPGQLIAFPGAAPPASAQSRPSPLPTCHGTALLDLSDPATPIASADLDLGSFVVAGVPLGIRAPFVYSESSDAFVIAFSTDPICWTESGRLAPIDTAFAAIEAIQDAMSLLVHDNPRILAVARVETMSRRIKALDAEIGATPDASKARIRTELARELIAARRALLVDAKALESA